MRGCESAHFRATNEFFADCVGDKERLGWWRRRECVEMIVQLNKRTLARERIQ
jgi:hypothetical protein